MSCSCRLPSISDRSGRRITEPDRVLQIPAQPGRYSAIFSHGRQVLEIRCDCASLRARQRHRPAETQHRRHIGAATVDGEMTMGNQQARLGAAVGKAQAEDHIIQAGFQDLQQVQTGQTTAARATLHNSGGTGVPGRRRCGALSAWRAAGGCNPIRGVRRNCAPLPCCPGA